MPHEGEYLAQRLLGGEIDNRAEEIERLTADVGRLERALYDAKQQSLRERTAIMELRRQLKPLFGAMQAVFGVIDATVADAVEGRTTQREGAVWEQWKQKLPGKRAEFIQALLDHGEMTSAQLKVVTHSGTSTVPQIIHQLHQLGLIQKNGGRFSLKRFA